MRLWLRQPELVGEHAAQVLHIVQQYDFPLEAQGTCLLGIADAQLGRAEEGLAQVFEGIVLYQEMKTPPVFWPQLLAINAAAHALAGTVAEGLVLWRSHGRDEARRCYAVCTTPSPRACDPGT
jgi:hypothetical protein